MENDYKTINGLAMKIGNVSSQIMMRANDIMLNTSSTSNVKTINEWSAKNIKMNMRLIYDYLNKLECYMDEMESHIYDGKINDE